MMKKNHIMANVCERCGREISLGDRIEYLIEKHGMTRDGRPMIWIPEWPEYCSGCAEIEAEK